MSEADTTCVVVEINPVEVLKSRVRSCGIDIFVIPMQVTTSEGEAWAEDGRRFINIMSDATGPGLAHIIAHELAHHLLGHTTVWTSLPGWHLEYSAEREALEYLAAVCDDEVMNRLTDEARAYVRPFIQQFLDHGITNHGEVPAGMWAGCRIPRRMRKAWRKLMIKDRTPRRDEEEPPL